MDCGPAPCLTMCRNPLVLGLAGASRAATPEPEGSALIELWFSPCGLIHIRQFVTPDSQFTKSTKPSTRLFPIARRFNWTGPVNSPRRQRSPARTELLEPSARSRQHESGSMASHRRPPTNQRVLTLGDRSHIPIEHFQRPSPSHILMAAVCVETAYFEAMSLSFSGEGAPNPRTNSVVSSVGINSSAANKSHVRSRAASVRDLLLKAGTVFSRR